jgi:membrane protein implicated in regulation of membrane protease activity
MELWHIWVAAGILMLLAEIFTSGFFTASIALGCFASAVVAGLGCDLTLQLAAFSVGTLGCFFGVKPLLQKCARRQGKTLLTNAAALTGQTGRVTETIDGARNEGRVIVGGDDWKAVTDDDEIVETGAKVQVVKVNSSILIVKRLN